MKLKQISTLIITVMMLISIVACGSTSTTINTAGITTSPNTSETTQATTIITTVASTSNKNPNEIELTLDNYSKYLKIGAWISNPSSTEGVNVQAFNSGNGIRYDGGNTYYLFKYFYHSVTVKGVSSNFNYNDIVITIRFTGTYKTVTLNTNEWTDGGEVNTEVTIECNIAGNGSMRDKLEGNGGYMHAEMSNIKYEIVAISGTVTPS